MSRQLPEYKMGHKLIPLPEGHPYEDGQRQCKKCGCLFDEDVSTYIANFISNCDLEQELRTQDPGEAIEILV